MREERTNENRVTETPARDANRDPITGAPGAHPVGTGVGATGGGAAGAAIGAAVGGPVGAAVGLAAGAIAGGLAGKGAAEAVNPTAEDGYVVCQGGPAFGRMFSENFEKEKDSQAGRSLSFPFL
jgi:hypothetical protein